MKQTVEEAAVDFADYELKNLDKLPFVVSAKADYDNGLTKGFKSGAEWQSKQSPWISVKERLPEPNKLVLCRMVSNGAIVSGYIVVSSGRSPYVATDGGLERLRV